ncbi:MAG: GNAT family N-acetyltransferase, partial [Roseiarcus sp.]
MTDTDFARRVEQLSGSAWPAIDQWLYDGWVLRFGRGYTKRVNSITPVDPGVRLLADKIAACEAAYAARHVRPVFRLPSVAEPERLDAALAERGYGKLDKTSVRLMPLDGALPEAALPVEQAPALTPAWLDCAAAWNGLDRGQRGALEAIIGRVAAPAAFALARDGARPAAIGLAVLQDDFVCLTGIIADPGQRRRGFGRAVTVALLGWARGRQARHAYLQVVKSNK